MTSTYFFPLIDDSLKRFTLWRVARFPASLWCLIVIAIASNMIGGQLISMLAIFLDSIGTLISAQYC